MELPKVLRMNNGSMVTTPGEWDIRRAEIMDMLTEQFLGRFPKNVQSGYETIEEDMDALGGKAVRRKIQVRLTKDERGAEFSFQFITPKALENFPVIIHLAFSEQITGMAEELIDEGFALAHVNYNEIEKDISEERFDGVQGLDQERNGSRWGKFGCWAFGVSRMIDALENLFHASRFIVAGHSRLAMTALWAGAMDSRIEFTAAINSGGLYRGTRAETFHDLSREYTRYWFCHDLFLNYQLEEELPFDMHFLVALIAPRKVFLDGATRDQWCDPIALYECGKFASPAYEMLGTEGLKGPDKPEAGQAYLDGHIGYYLRDGIHYFGRDDWHQLIRFYRAHVI